MGHARAPFGLLTTAEAAFVAGVGVREVNRAVDEGILEGFLTAGPGRRFSVAACVAMNFYFGSAKQLTAEERRFAIGSVASRLRRARVPSLPAVRGEDWTVRDAFLAIDMAPFLEAAARRLERLVAARAMVTASPDVVAGMPVITGTRVPVHDVAASREAGHSVDAVRAAYPTLTAEQVDLATVYARANPVRGRPRMAGLPEGATLISERRMSHS